MTISGVGASSAWDASITFTNSGAELAALIVESESDAAERTNEELEANKQRIARAADAEYEANLDAADAASRGAWISGGFAIAGGAAGVGAGVAGASDSAEAAKTLAATSQAFSSVSEPLSALVGEIPQMRHQAEAHRIGRSIEQANVEADQLAQQARRAEQRADFALDHASKLVEGENARANGVLSKF